MSSSRMLFSKFLTKEDPSFYINDFYEMGDVAFYGLIDGHMRARQAKECKRLGGAIQDKIYLGVSIREEVSRLNEMLPSSTRREFYSCNEILEEIKQGGGEIACRTGIGCIDRMVKILEGGFVVVIGGESSTGKTTITNQIAYRINADDVGHGMYFSTETDRARLGMRFVKYIKSLHGCTQDEANERFGEMKNLSISSAHYTPEMLIKEIRDAYNSEKGCKFVYVDYFQNLQFNGRNSKLEQLEDAIKGIHALAQELHIVIFVLSQLVKENYGPTVKTKPIPSLSTFRGCAQIGNSADVAMILQRPAMGPPDKSRPIPTDLFVVKQKEGEQCKIPLELLGSENTFVERESE